jgi:mycothiol system anti-sigma-R factor
MTRLLTCAETFAHLDDYLDRELSAADLAEVEYHLERCAVCSEEFGVEKELLADLKAKLNRVRMPDGLRERIAARLKAE